MKKRDILYVLLIVAASAVKGQQWVSFTVHPKNAILYVDGERHVMTEGYAEMLLPLGNHTYTAESPYFDAATDTFSLNDEARRDITIVMQSGYGYLHIQSSGARDKLYIDQHEIGRKRAQTIRYQAGKHRLTVLRDSICLCDQGVEITAGEKKIVDIGSMGITPFPWDPARWLVPLEAIGPGGELIDTTALAEAHAAMALDSAAVNVTSNVDGAQIHIDNRLAGTTPMVVFHLIANRKYLITLSKPGYKRASKTVEVRAEGVTDAYIKMKKQ